MTSAVVGDVLTDTAVAGDGEVVTDATVVEVDASALGRRGVVGDDAGSGVGAIDVYLASGCAAVG